MYRVIKILLAFALILGAGSQYASADSWQWPSQMNIGGFNISGISGSVNANGSGNAKGTLGIPGAADQQISLNRSSGGTVSGSVSMNVRVGGAQISGDFRLANNGLEGKGSVEISQRTISDASITVNSNGKFSGNGRLSIGKVSISPDFNISSGSSSVSGSGSSQAQEDTPLAVYQFNGTINLQINDGRQVITADGKVQRTGKLANQSSNYSISDVSVNTSDGHGVANVGGVSVTFKFF